MKRRSPADDQAAFERARWAAWVQKHAAWMRRHKIPEAPTAEEARELARDPKSRTGRKRRAQQKRFHP